MQLAFRSKKKNEIEKKFKEKSENSLTHDF